MELSIGLRNKVEHRYHEAINVVAMGYAQALLLNYEKELTAPSARIFRWASNFGFQSLLVQLPPWVRQSSSNSAMSCPKTRATLSRALSRTSIKRSLMTVVMSSALI
jgi:hypothetical protein